MDGDWCTDITYVPVQRGFLYFVAIMDWATRRVLSWWLSNTMEAGFCIEALDEAIARYGRPEIFNTDQGGQFTSDDFTGRLRNADIKISMDGKGRGINNRFVERLWRSLKYECVYILAFEIGTRGPSWHQRMDRLLQQRAHPFGAQRQNTGGGLQRPSNPDQTGGIIKTTINSIQVEN